MQIMFVPTVSVVETYISLSFIGSMSSMYCMYLLLITIPTPAVYSFLPPSALKTHVYVCLVSLLFWLFLVSRRHNVFMLFLDIQVSISSLTPGFVHSPFA